MAPLFVDVNHLFAIICWKPFPQPQYHWQVWQQLHWCKFSACCHSIRTLRGICCSPWHQCSPRRFCTRLAQKRRRPERKRQSWRESSCRIWMSLGFFQKPKYQVNNERSNHDDELTTFSFLHQWIKMWKIPSSTESVCERVSWWASNNLRPAHAPKKKWLHQRWFLFWHRNNPQQMKKNRDMVWWKKKKRYWWWNWWCDKTKTNIILFWSNSNKFMLHNYDTMLTTRTTPHQQEDDFYARYTVNIIIMMKYEILCYASLLPIKWTE